MRADFRLYIITDRKLVRDGDLAGACEAVLAAASEVAPRGAVAIQLREKDLDARPLYELAIALRALCSSYGAPLLINERIDVALAADADGVHLPFDSVGANQARKLLGPNRLIGSSTHSPPDVAGAAREGADFVVFGPVFDPISKDIAAPAWGPSGLRAACAAAQVPVFALGGITPERIAELYASSDVFASPAGAAAIGSIFQTSDIAAATTSMLRALMRS
ncbi:MAG TPA: thiamine phosphate synthase [Candidatus Binataceae bacterium]|nr:thiamine phosphate synthase [Candidatus Binataceae bacterium]